MTAEETVTLTIELPDTVTEHFDTIVRCGASQLRIRHITFATTRRFEVGSVAIGDMGKPFDPCAGEDGKRRPWYSHKEFHSYADAIEWAKGEVERAERIRLLTEAAKQA